jgi:hypothetical protein
MRHTLRRMIAVGCLAFVAGSTGVAHASGGVTVTTFSAAGTANAPTIGFGPCALSVAGSTAGADGTDGIGTFVAIDDPYFASTVDPNVCEGPAGTLRFRVTNAIYFGTQSVLDVVVTNGDPSTPVGTVGFVILDTSPTPNAANLGLSIFVSIGLHRGGWTNGLAFGFNEGARVSIATVTSAWSVTSYGQTGAAVGVEGDRGPCVVADAATVTRRSDGSVVTTGGGAYSNHDWALGITTTCTSPGSVSKHIVFAIDSLAGAGTDTPSAALTVTGGDEIAAGGTIDNRLSTQSTLIHIGDQAGGFGSDYASFLSVRSRNAVALATRILDHAPPVTTDDAPAGWHNAPVAVHLTATDPDSGIAATHYTVDGGPVQTGSVVTIGAPGDHSNDGTHVISYWSVDNAGNVEAPHTATVMIDTAPPVVAFAGNAGTYDVSQTVAITCSVSSTLAPIVSSTCPSVNAPAYTFTIGSNTLTASATDAAGNTVTATATFTVTVDGASLCVLVRQFDTKPNNGNDLCNYLRQIARTAPSQGRTNKIGEFQRKVTQEVPRWLTASQAAILIQLSNAL